jgi:hypothetical protein
MFTDLESQSQVHVEGHHDTHLALKADRRPGAPLTPAGSAHRDVSPRCDWTACSTDAEIEVSSSIELCR